MNTSQTDFSKGSVPRILLRQAVPLTLAQLVNLLYSIVDRMYLGRIPEVGRLALTGVGLCLPIISLVLAFANLCGTGGAPLCAIHRGRGEEDEARRVMGNSFTLLLLFGTALTAFGLAFRDPLLWLFGASDVTFGYAADYLTIYLVGTIFVMISLGMNPFINAQGFPRVGMLTVVLGAAVNIVLDPILIFLLDMGVRGAALATIISQGCSAAWVLLFLTGRRTLLRLDRSVMALSARRVKHILSLGLSGFFMAVTNSMVQVLSNATLQSYGGDLYVSVMTIVNAVREVISVPVTGLTHGCQPVLGYNYGAGEYGRVRESIRFIATVVVSVSLVLWAMVMLFPAFFIRLFNGDAELLAVGIPAFRMYFAVFFGMAFMFVGQSTFVGLGKAKFAIFFSILRKAGVVAPLILLLPGVFGLGTNGVFLAEPVSNVVGGMLSFTTMIVSVYIPLGRMKANPNRPA